MKIGSRVPSELRGLKNLLNVPKNDYRGLASEILILWEKGYLKSRESCKVELPIQIISSQ